MCAGVFPLLIGSGCGNPLDTDSGPVTADPQRNGVPQVLAHAPSRIDGRSSDQTGPGYVRRELQLIDSSGVAHKGVALASPGFDLDGFVASAKATVHSASPGLSFEARLGKAQDAMGDAIRMKEAGFVTSELLAVVLEENGYGWSGPVSPAPPFHGAAAPSSEVTVRDTSYTLYLATGSANQVADTNSYWCNGGQGNGSLYAGTAGVNVSMHLRLGAPAPNGYDYYQYWIVNTSSPNWGGWMLPYSQNWYYYRQVQDGHTGAMNTSNWLDCY
jgi:hypothetical protein